MSDLKTEAMTFEQKCLQAIEHSLIDTIRKGNWVQVDYGARLPITAEFMRQIHSRVDLQKVAEAVVEKVETKMADCILNSMATEVANDIKQILSNTELREDIRGLIRAKIRAAREALL